MEYTTIKLPRVGSKAYQRQMAAEHDAKQRKEAEALSQVMRRSAGIPDPADYMW